MEKKVLPLTEVTPGRVVKLVSIQGGWGLRRRLTDMGLYEGVKLRLLHSYRPGPCIIQANNTRLVLGYGMAHKIMVEEV